MNLLIIIIIEMCGWPWMDFFFQLYLICLFLHFSLLGVFSVSQWRQTTRRCVGHWRKGIWRQIHKSITSKTNSKRISKHRNLVKYTARNEYWWVFHSNKTYILHALCIHQLKMEWTSQQANKQTNNWIESTNNSMMLQYCTWIIYTDNHLYSSSFHKC